MKIANVLIANRGEISIRIARACAELGLRSVAVFSPRCTSARQMKRVSGVVAAQRLDATTGEVLYRFNVGGPINGDIITYAINGRQ